MQPETDPVKRPPESQRLDVVASIHLVCNVLLLGPFPSDDAVWHLFARILLSRKANLQRGSSVVQYYNSLGSSHGDRQVDESGACLT
jgi:hypothetical protein